jgi:hypothetical protein
MLILTAILALSFPQDAITKPNVFVDPALRTELLARAKKDQDVREKLIREHRARGLGPLQMPADVLKEMRTIDGENITWLKEIVEKRGWPGKMLVGSDGAHAAWLLVQHCDLMYQKKCLPLLEAAAKAKEADFADLAYLTDRVRIGEGKKQLYGTQLREVDGKFIPEPLEDEGNVDKRRKEVGLPPLAESLKIAAEKYMLDEGRSQPKK